MACRQASPPQLLALLPIVMGLLGCAPTVDILGVYFPGWLVSAIVGVAGAYGTVWGLGKRPQTREIADSGLFFIGLATSLALTMWWIVFSEF